MKTHARNIMIVGVWLGYWLMSAAAAQDTGTTVTEGESGPEQKSEAQADGIGQKISDATTTARVKSRLLLDDSTDGLKINVDTQNAEVTLNGTVKSEVERYQAEKIARETEGVRDVQNNLVIASASASQDSMSPERAGNPGYSE